MIEYTCEMNCRKITIILTVTMCVKFGNYIIDVIIEVGVLQWPNVYFYQLMQRM